MTKFILGLGLLLGACSGSDGGSSAPIECAQTDRVGTYLSHLVERDGGKCGPIADALGRIDSEELPAGCSFDAPDRWSEGDCKLERAYSCDEPGIGAGYTSKSVAVTRQQASDGSKITGTVTITILEPNGTVGCASTYDLTATRQ